MLALAITLTAMALIAATVVVHAVGTQSLIRYLSRHFTDANEMFRPHEALPAFIWTAIVLLMLHVIEIHLWAAAYLFVVPGDQLDTYEKAVYLSFVTYTTLGYGDVTLTAHEWRMLTGIEALDGILLAGWSTALLFVIVQRSWRYMGATRPKDPG
ncbi:MAG: potassium channel family protein [Chromatiaceae bacterium]